MQKRPTPPPSTLTRPQKYSLITLSGMLTALVALAAAGGLDPLPILRSVDLAKKDLLPRIAAPAVATAPGPSVAKTATSAKASGGSTASDSRSAGRPVVQVASLGPQSPTPVVIRTSAPVRRPAAPAPVVTPASPALSSSPTVTAAGRSGSGDSPSPVKRGPGVKRAVGLAKKSGKAPKAGVSKGKGKSAAGSITALRVSSIRPSTGATRKVAPVASRKAKHARRTRSARR